MKIKLITMLILTLLNGTTFYSCTKEQISESEKYLETRAIDYKFDLSLKNFRYVSQHAQVKEWQTLTKYTNKGLCEYPKYIGKIDLVTNYTNNLCGIASLLMAFSLVKTDPFIAVPLSASQRAIRMCELAARYKMFDSNFDFGKFTTITNLRNLTKGISNLKGELTNWNDCAKKSGIGVVEQKAFANTQSGRNLTKEFIKSHISVGRPILAIISISGKKNENANNSEYIKTIGGFGHFVLLVGVTYNETKNEYKVRFKDPWANDQTFEIDYTKFLNSMVSYSSNYNLLALGNYQ